MADTAALVVALSAQLTKFEKDMQKAGIMAERAVGDIENKFSKMNPQIKTSFFGNLLAQFAGQALAGAIEGVKELATRFTDLQKTAEYAGVSLQWLYGVQEVGQKAGVSVAEINVAVRALAFSLDEMKRGGDNALKTLLAANPKFLKGVKADALDAAGALRVVSEIMSKMSLLRAVDVGKNLGISEDTVKMMRQGGDAMADAIAKAAAKGPDLHRLAEQSAALARVWDGFLNSLKTSVIENFFSYFKSAVAGIIAILERFSNSQEGETIMGRAADRALDAWRAVGEELDKVTNKPKQVDITGGAVDPFARKGGAAQRDEFERANDQITKHIALMEADTAAVGRGVYEQERLKTETLLMEGVRRKLNIAEGEAIPINEELAAKINKQAEAAANAAQKNAEAKYQLQQMNAAAQVVGSALSTAFADAILEGKKLNDVLSQMLKTLARAAINFAIMAPFTPGAGGGAAPVAKLFGFAEGTRSAPGGLALVGERGPELVNLPRGSQVIPNDVLKNSGSIGGSIIYSPAIDARGASVEAVARLAQIMEQDRASFAARTVQTIQQARRGRIPGI